MNALSSDSLVLARKERCDSRVEAPGARTRQHYDSQPDAVERFWDVEQVAEPIGAIQWPPCTYPFDGVERKSPATNHEQPKRREHGQYTNDERASAGELDAGQQPLH